MWSAIGNALIKFLHYVSGLFVHPEKGGCCANKNDQNDQKEKEK